MTDNEIDRFYGDMTNANVEDSLDHEAEIAEFFDPDSAPDPEFADMAAEERTIALEDIAIDEYNEQWEREFIRRYPGVL